MNIYIYLRQKYIQIVTINKIKKQIMNYKLIVGSVLELNIKRLMQTRLINT